ncbi:MAG: hypothetical protein UW75_C0035G0001 [Parcubacteria group bacterium GW2011_GWF2_44_8]|nr:MAG: hypothetical protein UW75_C0035G0001 [Parcubacteria group bacterium GW2011_GWF2_44_8]
MQRFTNFDEEIKRGSERPAPHTPPKENPSGPRTTEAEKESY